VVTATDDVRLRIERDFVNTLERSPRVREESSRELLVANIGTRLGADLGLRKYATTRTYVIELVHVCARQHRGLELLADELAYLDPLAPEVPVLLCLCDEWEAAATYADDMWLDLRSTLHSVTLAGGDDQLAELAVLRRLAARATGSRMAELPRHCANIWQVFVHLAGANAMPNALPPCMALLEYVAQEINDPALARKLRKWNRAWAERWQLTDLLDAAPFRTAERRQKVHNVYLIIQIDPDPIDGNQLLVSHWRQWDPDVWRPQRGADIQVTQSTLEAEVDRLIANMEIMLGARTDVASLGELWLEFVLPADLLNLPVQLWSKTPLINEKIPLALDHPIVVRSLERLRTPRLHLAWRRRWAHMATGQVRPYWSRPSGDSYFTRLAAELSYDQDIMSVVLSEPPDPGNDTAHREINAALQAGIPAIIWHRSNCSLTEFRDAVMTMVADGGLVHLPQRIAAIRREALRLSAATPGHPGREVALLWDDPERLPDPPRGIG
jgi:vWA-MoxR associated protein C-terminal domain/vWA-MoxR associated protein middle region 0/Effector-associated domain 2